MQLSARSASRKASRFGVGGAALAVAIFVGYRKLPDNTSASFLPHLYCYLGNTRLIWLHVTSDLLIGLSYVAISSTLAYLVWRGCQSIHWRRYNALFSSMYESGPKPNLMVERLSPSR